MSHAPDFDANDFDLPVSGTFEEPGAGSSVSTSTASGPVAETVLDEGEIVAPPTERRSSEEGETPAFDGVEKRKNVVDRRTSLDRRVLNMGSPTGLERRRGPGRRRTDDRRSAEEGEMSDEQFEFVMAIDTYKRLNNKAFPTWTEILEVVKQLGYRKVAASTIRLPNDNGRATRDAPQQDD